MNSYISHFKWLAITAVCFVAIEAVIHFAAPSPEAVRNNFLELSFAKPEMVQRAFVATKVAQLDNADPDFIQVGDSSGLHGVQSPIIESYIGGRYLNMSVAANLGYWGYYALAEHFLRRSKHVKALVLYFTPAGAFPSKSLLNGNGLMAGDLDRAFDNPAYALLHVPSLGHRRAVTDDVYYLGGLLWAPPRPLIPNNGYLMLRDIVRASGGWARETDIPGDKIPVNLLDGMRRLFPDLANVPDDEAIQSFIHRWPKIGVESQWDWSSLSMRTCFQIVLDRYLALAKRHGAKLIVITNPAPEFFLRKEFKNFFRFKDMQAELVRYAKAHPEVAIAGLSVWPDSHFSVFSHVGTPYEVDNSIRVAKYLKSVLGKKLPPRPKIASLTHIDMRANPTIYEFGDVQRQGAHGFRSLEPGRDEGLIYLRAASHEQTEITLKLLNKPGDAVLKNLSLSAFGVRARLIGAEPYAAGTILRFLLPEEVVGRYDGWLELTISTRGATHWQTNALIAGANGPALKVETLDIARPRPERKSASL